MLTLDDAVKVTRQLVNNMMDNDDIIRQELEQKCWDAIARTIQGEQGEQ